MVTDGSFYLPTQLAMGCPDVALIPDEIIIQVYLLTID